MQKLCKGESYGLASQRMASQTIDLPSTTVRQVVDDSSKYPRNLFAPYSGAVREVFDCCSGTTRRTAEGHSNDYRSCPEQVPKRTRSASEGCPNSPRRNRWFFDRFLDKLKGWIKYRCSIDVVLFMQLLRKIEDKFLTNIFGTSGVPYPYLFNPITTQAQPKNDLRITQERPKVDPSLTQRQPYLRTGYRQGSPKDDTTNTQETANNDIRKRVGAIKNKVTLCLAGLLCVSLKNLFFEATKNKRILHLGFFCFMLFNLSDAWAQSAETRAAEGQPEIKPLKVGDTIPEELWHQPFQVTTQNGTNKMISLDQYRGKPILLDFWSTWCPSCIRGFPKLEKLQQEFGEKIKIILVNSIQTNDTEDRITETLTRYRENYGYEIKLDYILFDTLFQTMFPHHVLPHFVWIDSQGKFRANSYSEAVNPINIKAAIQGDFGNIHQKDDFALESADGSLFAGNFANVKFNARFTGYIEGAGMIAEQLEQTDRGTVYKISNYPLAHFYQRAYADIFSGVYSNLWRFSETLDKEFTTSFTNRFDYENLFCYEWLLDHNATLDEARDLLRETLEQTFRVRPIRVRSTGKAVVFQVNKQIDDMKSEGGIPQSRFEPTDDDLFIRNQPLSSLLKFFGRLLQCPIDIQGDANYNIDLILPTTIYEYTENDIAAYLSDLGVEMIETLQEADYIVFESLTDK